MEYKDTELAAMVLGSVSFGIGETSVQELIEVTMEATDITPDCTFNSIRAQDYESWEKALALALKLGVVSEKDGMIKANVKALLIAAREIFPPKPTTDLTKLISSTKGFM